VRLTALATSVAAVLCAALLVAGCGGGDSGGSNTTAPPAGKGAPKKATAPNAPAGSKVVACGQGLRATAVDCGTARRIMRRWENHRSCALPEGGVTLRFSLPETAENATWPAFTANYIVRVTDALELELIITNAASDQPFSFESCLHTYYAVGDISAVSITGLKGASYLDRTDNSAQKTETADAIKINSEVDRTFFDTAAAVEIVDQKLQRKIRVEKENSLSTVVWNPWIAKAKAMADFGDDEWPGMVCIETANAADNAITLAPGATHRMTTTIAVQSL